MSFFHFFFYIFFLLKVLKAYSVSASEASKQMECTPFVPFVQKLIIYDTSEILMAVTNRTQHPRRKCLSMEEGTSTVRYESTRPSVSQCLVVSC